MLVTFVPFVQQRDNNIKNERQQYCNHPVNFGLIVHAHAVGKIEQRTDKEHDRKLYGEQDKTPFGSHGSFSFLQTSLDSDTRLALKQKEILSLESGLLRGR
jgi:hypothetical protein